MKQALLFLLAVAAIASASPGFAGPDWTVIERGRAEAKAKLQNSKPSDCVAQHPNNHAFCAPRANGGH